MLDILHGTLKRDVAFVPTFLAINDNPEKFAAVSYGFSMWGGRTPSAMATRDVGRQDRLLELCERVSGVCL